MQLQPDVERSRGWSKGRNIGTSDGARLAWHMVIHDLLHTNNRLHRFPTGEHGQLFTVREAGHRAASTNRMCCESGNLGMDPNTNREDK